MAAALDSTSRRTTGGKIQTLSSQAILQVAQRELSEGLTTCDEALSKARAAGDSVNEARVLGTMGTLYLKDGRTELAKASSPRRSTVAATSGETRCAGFSSASSGWTLHELKDEPRALELIDSRCRLVGGWRPASRGSVHGYRRVAGGARRQARRRAGEPLGRAGAAEA